MTSSVNDVYSNFVATDREKKPRDLTIGRYEEDYTYKR